jgi:hypothetical protein
VSEQLALLHLHHITKSTDFWQIVKFLGFSRHTIDMTRKFVTTLLISMLVLLTGCASESYSDISTQGATEYSQEDSISSDGEAAYTESSESKVGSSDRAIVERVYLSFEVQGLPSWSQDFREDLTRLGGYVDTWDESSDLSGAIFRMTASVRVPAGSLESFLQSIRSVASNLTYSQSLQDVTVETLDLESRISVLEASISRLEEVLADAKNLSELLEAENFLTQREAELHSLRSQAAYWAQAVAYATVHMDVAEQNHSEVGGSNNFWDSIMNGWMDFSSSFNELFLAIAYLSPWLALLAVLSLIGWKVYRGRIRNRTKGESVKPKNPN